MNGDPSWSPPAPVRTAVWIVNNVGVTLTMLGVVVAVVLGWVDSPLMHIGRIPHVEQAVLEHQESSRQFQGTLIDSLRKNRCMQAVSSITAKADVVAAAALSADPCVYLENIGRRQ